MQILESVLANRFGTTVLNATPAQITIACKLISEVNGVLARECLFEGNRQRAEARKPLAKMYLGGEYASPSR